jgi:D-glycerate 3-kinase
MRKILQTSLIGQNGAIMNLAKLDKLIATNGLPTAFRHTVNDWYLPLANAIAAECYEQPLVVGVQGSQGSGKSTLAQFIKILLEENFSLRCVELSLDDFYLRHSERQTLAQTIHPLLQTRGVPGTHDVELAINTIDALCKLGADESMLVPRFNKAIDDRFPPEQWDKVTGSIDVILFEGWCVGCAAQDESELNPPINRLEQDEDSECLWRRYVNAALNTTYPLLFEKIQRLVVLQAPSFDCVYSWRWLQEQKLIASWQAKNPEQAARLLDEASVRRFVSHFERLTRHCLNTLPAQADWVLTLNTEHEITRLTTREGL